MLKGLGNLGDMGKLMKQAQEMQSKMAEAQASLEDLEVTGQSGAGMIEVTLTAKGTMKGLKLDASLMNSEDKEILEDLIIAAHNDARVKAEAKSAEEMQKVAGGLGLPAGMKLPF